MDSKGLGEVFQEIIVEFSEMEQSYLDLSALNVTSL